MSYLCCCLELHAGSEVAIFQEPRVCELRLSRILGSSANIRGTLMCPTVTRRFPERPSRNSSCRTDSARKLETRYIDQAVSKLAFAWYFAIVLWDASTRECCSTRPANETTVLTSTLELFALGARWADYLGVFSATHVFVVHLRSSCAPPASPGRPPAYYSRTPRGPGYPYRCLGPSHEEAPCNTLTWK